MAKKKERVVVRCMNCKHAQLHQWAADPIIALCFKNRIREVANAPRYCDFHEADRTAKTITHHQKDFV